jgi:DNA-binding response OmpR family regulator
VQIALVEDDPAQAEIVQAWLMQAGHDCHHFPNGKAFIYDAKRHTFDLVILDWMLPDTSGPDLLNWVRENIDWEIPVLFTTSRDSEQDIVFALTHGADDYMIKPVKPQETIARINALLRRSAPADAANNILEAPPYVFDIANRGLSINSEPLELTQKEYDLALFLFRHAGRLLSRSYLLENIWGMNSGLQTRTVDTHISRIRKKLGLGPEVGWRLSSVYQHGYRLEQTDAREGTAARDAAVQI